MVHHGYKRPGDGQILGDCRGVGIAPLELSSQGLRVMASLLEGFAVSSRALAIVAENADIVTVKSWTGELVIQRGDARFPVHHLEYITKTRRTAVQAGNELRMFRVLAKHWVMDDLPEVRFPQKRPLKLQPLIDRASL